MGVSRKGQSRGKIMNTKSKFEQSRNRRRRRKKARKEAQTAGDTALAISVIEAYRNL